MKKLLLLITLNCLAQAPSIEWQKSLGGSNDDTLFGASLTNDGGYVVAGYSNSTNNSFSINHGSSDGYIVKLNATGTVEWQKLVGGSLDDSFSNVISTSDGGIMAIGYTKSNDFDVTSNYGGNDVFLVKMNQQGDIVWTKTYGGADNEVGNAIEETNLGGYIIAGTTTSNTFNGNTVDDFDGTNSFLLKIDADGNIQWVKTYGSNSNDSCRDVIQCTDGGYATANITNANNFAGSIGYHSIWVFKTNETGELLWQKVYGDILDWTYSLQQTSDNGFIVSGNTVSGSSIPGGHGAEDAFLIKLDMNGDLQWQYCYGGSAREYALDVFETTDGNYIFTGGASSQNNGQVSGNQGSSDYWVAKTDANGTIIWQNCYGGSSIELAYAIKPTPDNGLFTVGKSRSSDGNITSSNGNYDCWAVKLNFNILNNENFTTNSPKIYPNPASSYVNIYLDQSTSIDRIKITNALGEIVKDCKENLYGFDSTDFPQGIYFVQLFFGNTNFQTKFIKK